MGSFNQGGSVDASTITYGGASLMRYTHTLNKSFCKSFFLLILLWLVYAISICCYCDCEAPNIDHQNREFFYYTQLMSVKIGFMWAMTSFHSKLIISLILNDNVEYTLLLWRLFRFHLVCYCYWIFFFGMGPLVWVFERKIPYTKYSMLEYLCAWISWSISLRNYTRMGNVYIYSTSSFCPYTCVGRSIILSKFITYSIWCWDFVFLLGSVFVYFYHPKNLSILHIWVIYNMFNFRILIKR